MASPVDLPVVEDERGVDISQIRRQLALSVPERVRVMVEAAHAMIAIQERAQAQLTRAANRPKDQRDLPYLESLRDQRDD